MRKITIKEIIDFRRKSIKSRESFIKKLGKEKITTESGGDYWISAISAIGRAFKTENNLEITDKINDLLIDIEKTDYRRTKMMYQRNLDILHNFEDFDFMTLRPYTEIEFLKKPKMLEIIDILNLPVKVTPSHVYTFEKDGKKFVGGLWFACKLNGYTIPELATFTEGLYKYLDKNYNTEHIIDEEFCIAVDAFNGNVVNYSDIKNGDYIPVLNSTIPLIKEIM